MRERRFLVTAPFGLESRVEIIDSEAHHLLHVLRLRQGDEIVVFDGKGRQHRALITACGRQSATAGVREALPSCESPITIAIAVALPKGDKMSSIVRMLTELGVNRIVPLMTSRSTPKDTAHTRERVTRWERVALEACKQSGRCFLPTIDNPLDFDELLNLELPSNRFLICPDGGTPSDILDDAPCLALIGPEGGWSSSEIEKATSRGFHRIGLGPRTLRVETAAVATAALLQWRYGDLKGGR